MLRNIKSWLGSGISADSFPPQVTTLQHLATSQDMDLRDFSERREVVGGANGVTNVLTRDFFHCDDATCYWRPGSAGELIIKFRRTSYVCS